MPSPAAGAGGVRDDARTSSSQSLRRRSQVTRVTVRELHRADGTDCRAQWTTVAPFLDATRHVREAGHRVIVTELRIRQYEPGGGTR